MAIATVTEEQHTRERRRRAAEQRVALQETPPLTQPGLRAMMNETSPRDSQSTTQVEQQRPASRQLPVPVSSAAHGAVALGRASGAVGAVSEWSVPSPGQPGSPFNANMRERPDRTINSSSVPARIMIDASEIPGREVAEGTTVSQATKEGLASGFTNGLGASLGSGSALGALAQVGEAAESSLTQPAGLDKRMERFPELRDVEVPTGNAARFPELVEDVKRPELQQQEQDEGYER